MKYDKSETYKVKDYLTERNLSAVECLNPQRVYDITQHVNAEDIQRMFETYDKIGLGFQLTMQHYQQMVARDLVKIHHERFGAADLDAGYVYVMSNPAWSGFYKIGCTIDVPDRNGTYQTYSPMRDYNLDFYFFTFDRRCDEKRVLDQFSGDHEWVSANLDDIKEFCKLISPYKKARRHLSVAQSGSVSDLESECRRFESYRADHIRKNRAGMSTSAR